MVVSIDKTSINGSILGAYGWGSKGGIREVASLSFQGRLSIISAIFSYGNWILKMSRCNTNSNIFIEFADEVRKLIKSKEYFNDKNILLLIDSASYHKTRSVVKKLNWFYYLVLFIPIYSPQFNSIELFFAALKAKIRGLRVEGTLKLSAEDRIQRITYTINQIKYFCYSQMISQNIQNIQIIYLKFSYLIPDIFLLYLSLCLYSIRIFYNIYKKKLKWRNSYNKKLFWTLNNISLIKLLFDV